MITPERALARTELLLVVALGIASSMGCGSESEPPGGSDGPPPPCDNCACPDGFAPDARGVGCAPVLAESCPAGTRPSIGDTECVPVGWSACPEGFAADPSGWGCRAVLPADACSGDELELLGSESCQPIACPEEFPPAAATLFVDDDFGAGELDATHFASIGAALAAAPEGATVAVEAGKYLKSLIAERDVTLSVPKLYFGYATGSNLLFPFSVGATSVLFHERCTADVLFEQIRKARPTILINVPTMVNHMVSHPRAAEQDLSCLRLATSAGEALPIELHERWNQMFGVELLDALGTAEM